ncbi:MAG TPA: S-layer homology domain-containing protein [Symbiobacteriaceae bacterium]|nr:S-layer homology domain-containing protein [Symbiobacteriaceae bacterium]
MTRKYRWVALAGAIAIGLFTATPALGVLVDMAGHWAAPLVGALEARGIVNGDEWKRFNPEAPLTRAQLAKLLVTGLGHDDSAKLLSAYPSRFLDMPRWHWARGYVESLAESAIIEGYPDATFAPEEPVTRVQLAAILVRAAGLSDQTRTMRFEPTNYTDDAAIPAWGRGAVHVARANGLMEGFSDGSFQPLQVVTRAEGATALARLLGARGALFHLTGTLVKWDPGALTGTVRDELGSERNFEASRDAQFFRGGVAVTPGQVRMLDQVWMVLGSDGNVRSVDARYVDVLGKDLTVSGSQVTVTLAGDSVKTYIVQPGVLVFANGRPSTLEKVSGMNRAYLALDRVTGEVRVLDAVQVADEGWFVSYESATRTITVQTEDELKRLTVTRDLFLLVDGEKAQVEDLQVGDRLILSVNEVGAVVYMQAER